MLEKGGFGTAYKAVLDDGNVVAVNGKKKFEQHMKVLGKLKHPNLAELRAYNFAKDEKLLVMITCLTETSSGCFTRSRKRRLEWATKVKIAARSGLQLVHSNIRSTNILIDGDGDGNGNARVPSTKTDTKVRRVRLGSGPAGAGDGGSARAGWVQSEWTAEVQIGLACTQASPGHRPDMGFVVTMIDQLRQGPEVLPSPSPLSTD